jgi:hypothetical protein
MVEPVSLGVAIKRLESMYPDKHPTGPRDAFDLGHRAGALEVIKHLQAMLERAP